MCYAGTPVIVGITKLELHLSEAYKPPEDTKASGEVRFTRALSAENNEVNGEGVDPPTCKHTDNSSVKDW